jgi:hypothetical protein
MADSAPNSSHLIAFSLVATQKWLAYLTAVTERCSKPVQSLRTYDAGDKMAERAER